MNLQDISLGTGWEGELTDSERLELNRARLQSDPRRRMDAERQFSEIVLERRSQRQSGGYRRRAEEHGVDVLILWSFALLFSVKSVVVGELTIMIILMVVLVVVLCLWLVSEWFRMVFFAPLWVGQEIKEWTYKRGMNEKWRVGIMIGLIIIWLGFPVLFLTQVIGLEMSPTWDK